MGHGVGRARVPFADVSERAVSEPIPLMVVGGFLGAGKTTLLNRLLTQAHGRRLAVLVNDFGTLSIDEKLITSHDGETISFANGCVCCTLGDSFMLTVDRLLERELVPELIVVEASGVADPANIAAIATLEPRLQRDLVVVLADAETVRERANDERLADTLARQLASADLLVLNKTDLVSASDAEETMLWLAGEVSAPVLQSVQSDVPSLLDAPNRLTPRLPGSQGTQRVQQAQRAHEPSPRSETHSQVSHPFTTRSVHPKRPITESHLREWLAALPPDVLRVKGVIDTEAGVRLVQKVGRRSVLTRWEGAPTGLQILSAGFCEFSPLE